MGKPKYKREFCAMLIEHMSQGLSFVSFGAIAKVSEVTLHQWAKDKPEFATAKAEAELKGLLWWEKAGLAGMVNKIDGFKPAIWIFTMKARFHKFGYRDNHDTVDAESEELRQMPTERLLKFVRGTE